MRRSIIVKSIKSPLLVLLIVLTISLDSNAQVNPHAIGIRGGLGNFGRGGEISYQLGLGETNRLELDLGWRWNGNSSYSHTAFTGIYHWVWNLDGGLNWFVGVGGQLGYYSHKDNSNNNGITINLGGQIGLEYDFNGLGAPIQIGLDARPMWGFLGATSGVGYGGAFSIRYTF